MKIPINNAVGILARYANRHGLITGATGTGKTVTLQKLCEGFSRAGVPVFVADIKGDISGLATANPVQFFDVYGDKGESLQISLDSLGPDLAARLLEITEAQKGVLETALDCQPADLKALQGLISGTGYSATTAALSRALKRFERQGGAELIGPDCFDVARLFDYRAGAGVVSILDAQKLSQNPLAYSSFLIWLLSELFERMPEAGDLERPRLVVFLDESHLLFEDCPPFLSRKLEKIVRLIRSKGVGLYFVSQFPSDIPPNIAGQLGNRIQHALRGATVQDMRAIKAAAESMPVNPYLRTETEIRLLGTGRAIVSFIQEDGTPAPCEKVLIDKPECRLGPLTDFERAEYIPEKPSAAPVRAAFRFSALPVSAYRFAALAALLVWFFG